MLFLLWVEHPQGNRERSSVLLNSYEMETEIIRSCDSYLCFERENGNEKQFNIQTHTVFCISSGNGHNAPADY